LEAVLSDEQLDALSGGPELVAEAVVLDAGEADAALGMGRTASAKDLAKGRQRLLRALEDVSEGGTLAWLGVKVVQPRPPSRWERGGAGKAPDR
jgi:hypothetical protein